MHEPDKHVGDHHAATDEHRRPSSPRSSHHPARPPLFPHPLTVARHATGQETHEIGKGSRRGDVPSAGNEVTLDRHQVGSDSYVHPSPAGTDRSAVTEKPTTKAGWTRDRKSTRLNS